MPNADHQPHSKPAAPNGPRKHAVVYVVMAVAIIGGGLFALREFQAPYHPDGADFASEDFAIERAEAPVVATPNVTPKVAAAKPKAHVPPNRVSTKLKAGMGDEAELLKQHSSAVLARLGHEASPEAVLRNLLTQAVMDGQSDAYIDSLLNAAAARGDFEMPQALTTVGGRLDTPILLQTMLLAVDDYQATEHRAFAEPLSHPLELTDSLARLSLHYYGHPLAHDRIADANAEYTDLAQAEVGQVVSIPAF